MFFMGAMVSLPIASVLCGAVVFGLVAARERADDALFLEGLEE